MDAELADLCQQVVTIEQQSGVANSAAKPAFGAAVQFSARIENKTDYRMMSTGDVVRTRGRVYMVPNGNVIPRVGIDRITLPATELVTQPVIVDVTTEVDENGLLDHIVVYF